MTVTHPTPTYAYLVCSTPRSGSTLLCELLKSTGVAGRPDEYFEDLQATGRPHQPRQYFDGVDDPEVLELLAPTQPGEPVTPAAFRATSIMSYSRCWLKRHRLRKRTRSRDPLPVPVAWKATRRSGAARARALEPYPDPGVRPQACTIRLICVGVGAGQPASVHTRTIASLVSKYTCQ